MFLKEQQEILGKTFSTFCFTMINMKVLLISMYHPEVFSKWNSLASKVFICIVTGIQIFALFA